jgi:hypothetical protein
MPADRTLACCCAAALALAVQPVAAQTPPVKPGLWQVQKYESDSPRGAGRGADMGEALKRMKPEARQRMEAMMKERGIEPGAGGPGPTGMKMCLDRQSLEQGRWQGRQGRCTTDYISRTDKAWKWKATCTQPDSRTEGETTFAGSEGFTTTLAMTTTLDGQPRTTRTSMTLKWLGDDCGGLKPLAPPPAAPAR